MYTIYHTYSPKLSIQLQIYNMVCFLCPDSKGILGKLYDPMGVIAAFDCDTGSLEQRINDGSTRRANTFTFKNKKV